MSDLHIIIDFCDLARGQIDEIVAFQTVENEKPGNAFFRSFALEKVIFMGVSVVCDGGNFVFSVIDGSLAMECRCHMLYLLVLLI